MDIKQLKGIGDKTAVLFNRLSVYTVEDLVGLYPRDYDVYEKPIFIQQLNEEMVNRQQAIDGIIATKAQFFQNGRVSVVSIYIRDEKGDSIKCTWFNMPFLRTQLRQGMRCVFRGLYTVKRGVGVIEQPKVYTLSKYSELMGNMQPIYPLTKGLTNTVVIKAVQQVLEKYKTSLEPEFIPAFIRKKYELSEHNYACTNIHFPKSTEDYIQARKRLSFEEFFLFVLAVRKLKTTNDLRVNKHVIKNDIRTEEFINRLPYKLTNAQQNTWNEIKSDLAGCKIMNRLIQGDVGSGKTIIAVLAMMNAAYSGGQAAMMVPTEVLAKQQYDSICDMFNEYGINLKVSILLGSMTATQKKKAYEDIQNGSTAIIIGTHALIQEKVIYNKLTLVITDEQHRFGVNQRKSFQDKGESPHVLVMSATPIPRTLAIIVYGDLDISVIDELPADRIPIKNCVVDTSYREKAYSFITQQVKEGRQIYVICPMVEESESIDAENVIDYSKHLAQSLPKGIRIAYLHGKMKTVEKETIMDRFYKREIDVLVSTTVIEVGVNVPNATVIMIENADRFGLAQLHQLRGRVGRGKYQSYCIFVSSNKKTKERLEILNKSNDGFKIAEEDLKLRGPGDFFGIRQSGDMEFKIGDIFTDSKVLKQASDAATAFLNSDVNNIQISDEEIKRLNKRIEEYTKKCLEKINL